MKERENERKKKWPGYLTNQLKRSSFGRTVCIVCLCLWRKLLEETKRF
jgi:hypothetical protein